MPKFSVGLVRKAELIIEADNREVVEDSLIRFGTPHWLDFDNPEIDFIHETNMTVSPYELGFINEDGEIDFK